MKEKFWTLNDRQLCDCEMILDKSFAPLDGFMNEDDYNSVLVTMRLQDKSLFPLPITLDITEEFANDIQLGDKIILREKEGFQIASMLVESKWEPNKEHEAISVYKTMDLTHPSVFYLFKNSNKIYVGGKIVKINSPIHYDFKKYRLSPQSARKEFEKKGWVKIVAFQTRNPLHRAHVEMTLQSMKRLNANLFLHPVVGITKPGDVDHYTRVRCYEHVISKYPKNTTMLALLPLAMRMAGPREALLHAIIRKNFGCTHIIIGRDHAGPGNDGQNKPFYGKYEAQELLQRYENEIGIKTEPFQLMVYVPKQKKYFPIDHLNKKEKYLTVSGTYLRKILDKGDIIPEWFTYPAVADELKKSVPPKNKRGFTVFFTGLSGSGKSTIANGLVAKLLEVGGRSVTLLDGDLVRTHLSTELGFSKCHRSLNIQRIGFVASEITKNRGIAICAPIAPYESDRSLNRKLISDFGGYFEVFVNTSLKKCEERDSKGLYKLARDGKLKQFTGISDPYEVPENPDIIINSDGSLKPEILVDMIYTKIKEVGYV